MASEGREPTAKTNNSRYAEIIGGDTPSPFAAAILLAALGCALLALWTWPAESEWWYVAAILAGGAVILAAFAYLGPPGQHTETESDGNQ